MFSDYLSAPGPSVTLYERKLLKMLAEIVEGKFIIPIIVNIGVFRGCTMHCLRAGSPDASLYGIDIDYSEIVHKKDSLNAIWVEADSGSYEFDGDVHLLFIDGDHSYSGVRRDILNWQDKIVSGGIIAFHDYNPTDTDLRRFKLEGVRQAVDELCWPEIGLIDSIMVKRKQ